MAEAEAQNPIANLKAFKAAKVLNGTNADLEDSKNLAIVEIDPKSLGTFTDDDVLIKVEAFALNPVDYKMNTLFAEYPTEHIICSDACGIVEAVGKNAGFEKGDRVICNTNLKYGVGAEYIKVNKDLIAKVDAGMNAEDMSGLPLVSTTAYDAVMALGDLEAGAKVMINGASGGVGTMVTQMCANVFQYHTIAICSGKNQNLVEMLGAREVINYKEQDFAEYGGKVQGFIDLVGGKSVWDKAQNLLEEGAFFSTIVGDDPTFKDNSTTFARSNDEQTNYKFVFYTSNGEKLAQIVQMVKDEKLKPWVHADYPARMIRDAMKEMKSRRATGKIVVRWGK